MDAIEYCQNKITSKSTSLSSVLSFLNPESRNGITALYAFSQELDDIVDIAGIFPDDAKAKLSEWRKNIDQMYLDQLNHPITEVLHSYIKTCNLEQSLFQELINGKQITLEKKRFEYLETFIDYCHKTGGTLSSLGAQILSHGKINSDYADHLGIAVAMTKIIRDLGEDINQGRFFLPEQTIAQFGLEQTVFQNKIKSPKFISLMQYLYNQAKEYFSKAQQNLLPPDRKSQKPMLVIGAVYEALLDQIHNENYPVFESIVSLSSSKKLMTALSVWSQQ